jgi:methionyl-tRNA formyltransferase
LRVLFFGMEGLFSRAPLAALLAAELEVCAVVVPRPAGVAGDGVPLRVLPPPGRRPRELPIATAASEPTIVGLAWAYGVPVLEVGRLAHPETLTALHDLRPDVLCVACFPRLLPRELLDLARHGGLNVHPSLLPAYRGPAPLFWVFHGQTSHSPSASTSASVQATGAERADVRPGAPLWLPNEGLGNAGVTVHLLDNHADTGDIVAQAPIVLPDGITYGAAERICSQEGARLLVEALEAMAAGRSMHRRQPQIDLPTAPVPTDADFVITRDWSARRAFNFIRGVGEWGRPMTMAVDDARFSVREAVSYDAEATMSAPMQRVDRHVRIRGSPGVLIITGQECS